MSIQELVALVTTLVGVPVALARLWREIQQKSPRDLMLQDIEIRNALPPKSDAQKSFDAHIERVAARIIDTRIRRDPGGAVLGILFLVFAGLFYWLFTTFDAWWHWLFIPLLAFFLLFGVVGTADSLVLKERKSPNERKAKKISAT